MTKRSYILFSLLLIFLITILTGCYIGDGTKWVSGTDVNSFVSAKLGDYFIDTDDNILYKKTQSNWVVVMENFGKSETIVEEGTQGEKGSQWFSGSTVPTTEGRVGDFYLNTVSYDLYEKLQEGWVKIGNIKPEGGTSSESADSKDVGDHYMISNGIKEMAANAVEMVVDDNTGIVYAVYLASESSLGESSALVKMAKFNILQPTKVEYVEVFNKTTDFSGSPLSECNIIELNSNTVRVFAVNKSNWTYYYKDVNKKDLSVGKLKEVKFKSDDNAQPLLFSKANINSYLSTIGGTAFNELQATTKIIKVDSYFYTTVCGGNNTNNILFMKSADGESWTVESVLKANANYEAMLSYHDSKFWVMCRQGTQTVSDRTYQNLWYSADGKSWSNSNLALKTSDTRPYLFNYDGDLYLAYSSPMSNDYSTVRPWRCNIHVGRIVSSGGVETFEEIVYKESKFGIVYYAITEWYGKMIMLYSSGELNPTEGLMGGWSQGKDCLNYTVIYSKEPNLSFKTLESISVSSLPYSTKYFIGDTFLSDGLEIVAKYKDGSSHRITNYEITSPDMTESGEKTVIITYTENGIKKSCSFDIFVLDAERILSSIEIISGPNKLSYILGEEFNPEGLVIRANYSSDAYKIISDYQITAPDTSSVGKKTVTVSYTEKDVTVTTCFTVEVTENGYSKLEYIISNGNSNIDTKYKTSANTKVVIKLDKPSNEGVTGGKWMFNSTPKGGDRNFGLCFKPDGAYVLDYGNVRYQNGVINWKEGVNTITFGNGIFTINDDELVTGLNVNTTPTSSAGTLTFFTAASTSSSTYLAAKVYEISVYEGEEMVMHLIPVQRSSDGKVGFYDTVNNTYYFSQTSTDFIAGPFAE
jgi:hypothetical protein